MPIAVWSTWESAVGAAVWIATVLVIIWICWGPRR